MMLMSRAVILLVFFLGCAASGLGQPASAPPHPSDAMPPVMLRGMAYEEEFFPGAAYDEAVPAPDSVIGFKLGAHPVSYGEVEAVLKAIAEKSPRVKLFEYGKSHEGRTLWYAVIGTPERMADLEGLRSEYARLADPRKTNDAEADALVERLPALAWMAYVIHGNELSGTDAALGVLHHLAAGQGEDVKRLLDNLVIVIDPLMNPDGRDRCVSDIAENRARQPQVDDQALLHTGIWPGGRMNHYLFDMNRDWIFATQPETRGRIASIAQWNPHYFMESHEMWSQDTFLFLPAREPILHHYGPQMPRWETRFAEDHARAFDARGWRYYTGEWNENWYPGYSSSWAALRGSVSNLYEQARIFADAVRRPEGTLETYRESVHKQVVSTMANLETLASSRREVLRDFVADRRLVMSDGSPYAGLSYVIVPGANAMRLRQFLDLMRIQGIEVHRAGRAFRATGKDRLGREVRDREFGAGSVVIPGRQPLARLAAAMLEFDPRMKPEFLTIERRELLRFDRSKLYDVTGWSLPMLHDVECYEVMGDPRDAAGAELLTDGFPPGPAEVVVNPATTVAFVIDGADDASVSAAARLMERGVQVRVCDKPIEFEGRAFARGSVLVMRKDNELFSGDLVKAVGEVCASVKTAAWGIGTGLGAGDLPDLGGEHFILLRKPSIAVLGREPTGPYSFGQAWHTLDVVYGVRASYVSFEALGGADLRRYNVLVIPEADAAGPLVEKAPMLKAWIEAGGTLVALGSSAAALADEKGIGSTRTLASVVAKPEQFIQAVIREYHGLNEVVDPARAYAQTPPTKEAALVYPWDGVPGAGEEKPSEEEIKRRDEWRRIFSPQGAVVAARIDDRSWLTAGCGEYVPVVFGGNEPLAALAGRAPVRLGVFTAAPEEPKQEPAPESSANSADADDKAKKDEKPKPGWTIAPPGKELRLRMSGLLWPEAAERLANSAYVTRESIGAGQLILFAADPNFRAATLGTSRIFANAVVYGPGMGASQPIVP